MLSQPPTPPPLWSILNFILQKTQKGLEFISMAYHVSAVTPSLMHSSYCSLVLSHRYDISTMDLIYTYIKRIVYRTVQGLIEINMLKWLVFFISFFNWRKIIYQRTLIWISWNIFHLIIFVCFEIHPWWCQCPIIWGRQHQKEGYNNVFFETWLHQNTMQCHYN